MALLSRKTFSRILYAIGVFTCCLLTNHTFDIYGSGTDTSVYLDGSQTNSSPVWTRGSCQYSFNEMACIEDENHTRRTNIINEAKYPGIHFFVFFNRLLKHNSLRTGISRFHLGSDPSPPAYVGFGQIEPA